MNLPLWKFYTSLTVNKLFFSTSIMFEEISLRVIFEKTHPFQKKGKYFHPPNPPCKKWSKSRAAWITSLHSGLPELPPPPDGPRYIISMSGIFTKGLYQKNNCHFWAVMFATKKSIEKRYIFHQTCLEDCHTIPYRWGLFFWPGVTKLGRIKFHQFENRNVFFPAHLGCNFLFPHPISGPTRMSSMVSPSSAFCWDGLGEIWKNMWSLRSDDPLFYSKSLHAYIYIYIIKYLQICWLKSVIHE